MEHTDTRKTIENRIEKLPLIDVAVYEIISLLNSPDSNFQQIIEKLSPGVAARFLNMANSAYYGREVRSLDHAVRLLGYKEMKQILITSVMFDQFTRHLDYRTFSFEKFGQQAHFCAAISSVLGEIMSYPSPGDLYTVGVLHNIGKMVIAVYFKEEHKQIIAVKQSEGITTAAAEQRILGADHSEIGGWLLNQFKIPDDIRDAVRFHDAPGRETFPGANYQLEGIIRHAAGIVGEFRLPGAIGFGEIVDRLAGAVAEGKNLYREAMRAGLFSHGYQATFIDLLEKSSVRVTLALKTFLTTRVSPADNPGEKEPG